MTFTATVLSLGACGANSDPLPTAPLVDTSLREASTLRKRTHEFRFYVDSSGRLVTFDAVRTNDQNGRPRALPTAQGSRLHAIPEKYDSLVRSIVPEASGIQVSFYRLPESGRRLKPATDRRATVNPAFAAAQAATTEATSPEEGELLIDSAVEEILVTEEAYLFEIDEEYISEAGRSDADRAAKSHASDPDCTNAGLTSAASTEDKCLLERATMEGERTKIISRTAVAVVAIVGLGAAMPAAAATAGAWAAWNAALGVTVTTGLGAQWEAYIDAKIAKLALHLCRSRPD